MRLQNVQGSYLSLKKFFLRQRQGSQNLEDEEEDADPPSLRQSPALEADRLTYWPEQGSSRLLSLPLEIRLEILKSTLANDIVHCMSLGKHRQNGTVGFFVCPDPSICACPSTIYPEEKEPFLLWLSAKSLPGSVKKPAVAILRVCRQLYSESADLLYQSNTFRLHDLWSMTDLRLSMPTHRFQQIRRLSLHLSFGSAGFIPGSAERTWNVSGSAPVTDKLWEETWEGFAERYSHVRDLELVLEVRNVDTLIEAHMDKWTGPLLAIKELGLREGRIRVVFKDFVPDWKQEKIDDARSLERKVEALLKTATEARENGESGF